MPTAVRQHVHRAVVVLACVPAAVLIGLALTDGLGANPVEELTHETGEWALRFLVATLAVTPLRRGLGLSVLAPYRRSFGLLAFAYACLHFGTYLFLDLSLDLSFLVEDVLERPYITAGFVGFCLLVPLAVTSTRGWQRRLGSGWRRLHRLAYLAAVAAVVHYLWLVKSDLTEPAIYAAIVAGLLAVRLVGR